MFEGVVHTLLDKYLGRYVVGLNRDALKVAIWQGDIVLENLALRESSLDELDLPIQVRSGVVGKLRMTVPWSKLKSEPVVLRLDGVELVAGPHSETHWTEDKAKAREQADKKKALRDAELVGAARRGEVTADSLTQRLLTKVTDNVQLHITNVHIRYEDSTSYPAFPFSLGMRIQSLSARSTNANWQEAFLSGDVFVHKLCRVDGCEVYLNALHEDGAHAETVQHVLPPADVGLRLIINKDLRDLTVPRVIADASMDRVAMRFTSRQYAALLGWLDRMGASHRYDYLRPPVRPREDAAAWWRYAGACTRARVCRELERRSWAWMRQFGSYRREYVMLYKKHRGVAWVDAITPTEQARLRTLEERLDVDDVLFLRSLADMHIRAEVHTPAAIEATRKQQQQQQSGRKRRGTTGWLGGLWGGGAAAAAAKTPSSSSSAEGDDGTGPLLQLSPQELSELYRQLDIDPAHIVDEPATLPDDYVRSRFTLHWVEGSLQLVSDRGRHGEEDGAAVRPLARFVFTDLSIESALQPRQFSVDVALGSAEMWDLFTPNTAFPCLLTRHTADSPVTKQLAACDYRSDVPPEPPSDVLCRLRFVQRDTDQRASRLGAKPPSERTLSLQLDTLDLVYNARCVDHLLRFFRPADPITLASLQSAAVRRINEKLLQVDLGDRMHIMLDVRSPVISIPENFQSPHTVQLVLDLGHLSLNTKLGDDTAAAATTAEAVPQSLTTTAGATATTVSHPTTTTAGAVPHPTTTAGATAGTTTVPLSPIASDSDDDEFFDASASGVGASMLFSPPAPSEAPSVAQSVYFDAPVAQGHSFYDSYTLHLKRAHLLVLDPGAALRHAGRAVGVVVRDFDLSLTLQVCLLPSDPTLPKIKLSGNLPALEICLSSTQLGQLARTLSSLSGEPEVAHREVMSHAAPEGAHREVMMSHATPPAPAPTTTLPAVAAAAAARAQSAATAEVSHQVQLWVQRKLFVYDLSVPMAMLSISHEHRGETLHVADLRLRGLQLNITQRPFDNSLSLQVKDVLIEDCLMPRDAPDEMRYIIAARTTDDERIGLDYVNTSEDSPQYEGVDTVVHFSFRTLEAQWNHTTITHLLSFWNHWLHVKEEAVVPAAHTPTTDAAPVEARGSDNDGGGGGGSMLLLLNVHELRMAFNEDKMQQHFATLCFTAMMLTWSKSKDDSMDIEGQVGSWELTDANEDVAGTGYEYVAQRRGSEESALHLHYTKLPQDVVGEDGFDSTLALKTNSVRWVYRHAFMTRVADYLSDSIIAAVVSSTANKVADRVRTKLMRRASAEFSLDEDEAMLDAVDEQRGGLKLDVQLGSPLIVLPTRLHRHDCIVADLGKISYANSFSTVDGVPVEVMAFHMTAMNLSSHLDGMERPGLKVVEDIDLALSLRKVRDDVPGAPPAHDSDVPRLGIDINMSDVRVLVSESDYALLWSVLRHNLMSASRRRAASAASSDAPHGGGSAPSTPPLSASVSPLRGPTLPRIALSSSAGSGSGITLASPQRGPSDAPSGGPPDVVVAATLRSVHMEIFRGRAKDASTTIGRMVMRNIGMQWVSRVESTRLEFVLGAVQLLDTRAESSNKYRDLFVPSHGQEITAGRADDEGTGGRGAAPDDEGSCGRGAAPNDEHIQLRLVMQEDCTVEEKRFELTIDGARLVVSADALLDIVDFFVVEQRGHQHHHHHHQHVQPQHRRAASSGSDASRVSVPVPTTAQRLAVSPLLRAQASPPASPVVRTTEPQRTHFVCRITNPQVVLLEDATSDTSRSLLLQSSLSADVHHTVQEDADGTLLLQQTTAQLRVEGMSLFVKGTNTQDADIDSIIEPTSFVVDVSQVGTTQQKRCVSLEAAQLKTRVSYQDIQLVMAIAQSWAATTAQHMARTKTRVRADSVTVTPVLARGSATPSPVPTPTTTPMPASSEHAFVVASDDLPHHEHDAAAGGDEDSSSVEQLYGLIFHGLELTIINDARGNSVPIVAFNVPDVGMTVQRRAEDPTMTHWSVNGSVGVDYYNPVLVEWEPLLEEWHCRVEIVQAAASPHLSMQVHATDKAELNITNSFLDNMVYTVRAWQREIDPLQDVSTFSPYWLHNETEHSVWWAFADSEETASAPEWRKVESGECVPFAFGRRRSRDAVVSSRARSIQLRVEDAHVAPWRVLPQVNVDKVGTLAYRLYMQDETVEGDTAGRSKRRKHKKRAHSAATSYPFVVAQVVLREGSKTLMLKSRVQMVNYAGSALDWRIEDRTSRVPARVLSNVEPGDSASLPVAFASGEFVVRARRHGTDAWSDGVDFDTLQRATHASVCVGRRNVGDRGEASPPTTSLCVEVKRSHIPGAPQPNVLLCFHPMLRLRNLLPEEMMFKLLTPAGDVLKLGTIDSGTEDVFYAMPDSREVHMSLLLPNFSWSDPIAVLGGFPAHHIVLLDSSGQPLRLCVANRSQHYGTRTISVYAQYWLVNKTSHRVLFRHPNQKHLAAGNADQDRSDKPLMYCSLGGSSARQHTVSVRVDQSRWSHLFNIDTTGATGVLDVMDAAAQLDHMRLYQLGVTIGLAPGRFRRTRLITFAPRYVIANATGHALFYQQAGTRLISTVQAGEEGHFHWSDHKRKRLVRVTPDLQQWTWSGSMSIDAINDFTVRVRNKQSTDSRAASATSAQTCHLRITVGVVGASIRVLVREQADQFAPYRIDNRTPDAVYFRQRGSERSEGLAPHRSVAYAWDEPTRKPILQVCVPGQKWKWHEYSLDRIATHIPFTVRKADAHDEHIVYVHVDVEGPTKVLVISNEPREAPTAADMEVGQVADAAQRQDIAFELRAALQGIGVSLIDEQPRELLYMSVQGLRATVLSGATSRSGEIVVKKIQIDNQDARTLFPILLWAGDDNAPALHASVVEDVYSDEVVYVKYLSINAPSMVVNVEEAFVTFVVDLLQRYASKFERDEDTRGAAVAGASGGGGGGAGDDEVEDVVVPRKVFFERLHVYPTHVTLSVRGSPADERDTSIDAVMSAFGVALKTIDKAPINFDALVLENAFAIPAVLASRIRKHYTTEALMAWYKVIGSADVLGNPINFVSTLGTGVLDFVTQPLYGMARSPVGFAEGVAMGTLSLVKNSVSAASSTASKLTSSVGRGAASMSMDTDYVARRTFRQHNEQPSHVLDGIGQGVKELGHGVLSGLAGVVGEPARGAVQGGLGGFVKGMGKGILGLATKTTAGVLDFASRTAQGVHNTATLLDAKSTRDRVRYPRVIGADGIVRPYNRETAYVQRVLWTVSSGAYASEQYVSHVRLRNHALVVVSNARILLRREDTVEWDLPWRHVANVQVVRGGVSVLKHNTAQFFVQCSNQAEQQRLADTLSDGHALWLANHGL